MSRQVGLAEKTTYIGNMVASRKRGTSFQVRITPGCARNYYQFLKRIPG